MGWGQRERSRGGGVSALCLPVFCGQRGGEMPAPAPFAFPQIWGDIPYTGGDPRPQRVPRCHRSSAVGFRATSCSRQTARGWPHGNACRLGADRGLLQCHQPNSAPSCGDMGMGHSCTQAACPEVLSPGITPLKGTRTGLPPLAVSPLARQSTCQLLAWHGDRGARDCAGARTQGRRDTGDTCCWRSHPAILSLSLGKMCLLLGLG